MAAPVGESLTGYDEDSMNDGGSGGESRVFLFFSFVVLFPFFLCFSLFFFVFFLFFSLCFFLFLLSLLFQSINQQKSPSVQNLPAVDMILPVGSLPLFT